MAPTTEDLPRNDSRVVRKQRWTQRGRAAWIVLLAGSIISSQPLGLLPRRVASLAAAEPPTNNSVLPMPPSTATPPASPTRPPGWNTVVEGARTQLIVGDCQARRLVGVDCNSCQPCGEARWTDRQPIIWQTHGQGEYIGPARIQAVPEYRLRVDDQLEFIYRLTRIESARPYELNVGDKIRVESLVDANLDRELVIQPDGMITLRLLGQVRAARRTLTELQQEIEDRYKKYYKIPSITVTPIEVNTRLEDLRAAVDSRYGRTGGQTQLARITPEGTIQLPAVGSVPAQGLTLNELKQEVDRRYAEIVDGLGVTPRLVARAPRYIYVVGEVQQPGRFTLEAPTTVMQAIALAGGWNNGGNLREIVVFRRAEDWRLIATKLDLRGALLGKRPCPADEIWLRDSDIVVLPKSQLLRSADFIDLVFTRGIYGVLPMQGIGFNFSAATSL